jgi:DNA polymerase
MQVHDELVCEVPDDDRYTSKTLAMLMAERPSWAVGLPLAAAGFETHRYRKD